MVAVHILHGRQRTHIPAMQPGDSPVVLPAKNLVVEIEGSTLPDTVILDGNQRRINLTSNRARGHLLLNAFGSVGFHRLTVEGNTYLFATEDAKLQLDGIQALLDYIGSEGLSWGNQLFFADGTALREPETDYAWLEAVAPQIIETCQEIADAPVRKSERKPQKTGLGGQRPLITPTMSLLRQDPNAYLENHHKGPIQVDNRRYAPRDVIAAVSQDTIRTPANRRATALLLATLDLVRSLKNNSELPGDAIDSLQSIESSVSSTLSLVPFSRLRQTARRIPNNPSPEEMTLPRYRKMFELYVELVHHRGWSPGLDIADRFSYVAYAHEIYESFVALVLAEGYDATLTTDSLQPNLPSPAFHSDRYDIYYDTSPPKPEFSNWRERSTRPSDMNPDITIVDRDRSKGILGDAKYRVTSGGRLPGSGLKDCQIYMQSFDVDTIVTFYPGPSDSIRRIEGEGNIILEISLAPFSDLATYVRDRVIPAIDSVMQDVPSP